MRFFVDTNVIVYTRDQNAPHARARAIDWLSALAQRNAIVVSPQVLNEATRVFVERMSFSAPAIRAAVRDMAAWCTASIDPPVTERALEVRQRWKFEWWDSLIVASALVASTDYLLTEDLQDGQDLEGLTVIDPFHHEPASILSAI